MCVCGCFYHPLQYNKPQILWMLDLENQEWWVKKLFDGMPTLPTMCMCKCMCVFVCMYTLIRVDNWSNVVLVNYPQ